MAGTISITNTIQLTNGDLEWLLQDQVQLSQTTARLFQNVYNVGTGSDTTVSWSSITTPGIVVLRNLDATNFCTWGFTTGNLNGRLSINDFPTIFRLGESVTSILLRANTAATDVLVAVLAK